MSRPGTRSKNKRQRIDDSDDSSSEILRKVHATGEISPDDIWQLYLIWKPICQGCRVNSKDSPNCFCGLIPPPNGTRKTGLWQRLPEIIQSLGPNPCKDHRTSTDTPAGLTNLGATCYANSILQCLYMNSSFREGIFSVEPDLLKHHPVLDQLARLFAQLHSSKRAFIDSAPFIKTLELDNGVQQDSHEFLTLFLSLLERSLGHSKVPNARTIVQDLFRGSVSHVTRCSICGKESDASSKIEDFYELELNIKDLSHLDESFDDYLNLEELHGENQYFCESCGMLVDATRCIKLRSLPSVLNLQLKRYVFLPKTTTKKKITSSFSFPRILNMEKRLYGPCDTDLVYELSAILVHKGTAVNSGHYVAHIKDEKSGHWWEFDDEHVSKLGFLPFGDSSKVDLVIQSDGSQTMTSLANGGHTSINHGQGEIYSSTDAYMLMYTSVSTKERIINSTEKIAVGDRNVHAINISLPVHFYKEIEELNSLYEKDCKEYQSRKDSYLSYITERREEIKQMLSEAPVQSLGEPFFWISTDWLRQWAISLTPSSIDNTPIQCSHGKVPFSKVTSMKRLSAKAWQCVFTKYEGGPALTSDDFCVDCMKGAAENAVSSDDYKEKRALLRELAEASLAGNHPNGAAYYVSRPWLLHWLRRRNVDNPCEADAGPTAALTCPHGDLLPEQAAGAKRVLVPEALWKFFHECASKVKPDDWLGSTAFPSDSEPCETCCRELTEVACFEDTLRAQKLSQRQNHEKLIMGKSFSIDAGCKYFLIPSSWLSQWRSYVTTTGKNMSSTIEPENLEVIMSSLICKQHSRLLERPLELLCKRGIISQKMSNTDGLTLISENDWKLFCEERNVHESKGIHAEIVLNIRNINKKDGHSQKNPIMDEELDHLKVGTNDEPEDTNPFIRTHPEICEDCIGERESSELVRKLNYCNEDICVHLVRGKEAPRSIIEASTAAPGRSSKRSKKTSYGNSINFKVSGTTYIYQLKMMIWEAFGVVKENQKLHKGSAEIKGDSATLADKSIFPGDTLWVMDTEIYENRDIADELSESKMEQSPAEEGFRGTLLTSDVPIQGFQEKPSVQ